MKKLLLFFLLSLTFFKTVFPEIVLNEVEQKAIGIYVNSVSWSPDGQYLAVGDYQSSGDNLIIYGWDGSSLTQLGQKTLGSYVNSVSWSPNGQYLAVGCYTSYSVDTLIIYGWDGSSLTQLDQKALTYEVNSVSWSPDGQYLAVGVYQSSGDNLIIYGWDGSSLTQLGQKTLGFYVNSVSWSPNGQYLTVGCYTSYSVDTLIIYRWDGSSLTHLDQKDLSLFVASVSWSPDGQYLAVGRNTSSVDTLIIYSWDGFSLTQLDQKDLGDKVDSLSWSPDGQYLAVGRNTSSVETLIIYSWDGSSLTQLDQKDLGADVNSVSWSPDGQYLAAGFYPDSEDYDLIIYATNDNSKEWTVLLFSDADYSGAQYIEQNLLEMIASGGTDDYVNIIAEVTWPDGYTYNNPESFESAAPANLLNNRYEVGPASILDKGTAPKMATHYVNSLVNSMRWAVANYPAKKYMLVLGGEARGIYDPDTQEVDWPRSILFDNTLETYMNNAKLVNALSITKTDALNGKKIDVLGMDASFMSGIEVAYQIRDYANYMVSNESSSPSQGWDYETALAPLHMDDPVVTPLSLVQNIVTTFRDSYLNLLPPYQEFTQAAIDLSKIDAIIANLNELVSLIFADRDLHYKEVNDSSLLDFVTKARRAAQEFQLDYFIDLYTFYSNLDQKVSEHPRSYGNCPPHTRECSCGQTPGEIKIQELRAKIQAGMVLIEDAIIINVHGTDFPRAKGLSCYFPWADEGIAGDYENTEFANNCNWYDFLYHYVPLINR